jgi:hypothetical protein
MNTQVKKQKDSKKSRKTVIAFLLMLSLVFTTGTFAYWASYVEGTSTEAVGTLEVGSGDTVETRFDLTDEFNSGGLLVPVGQLENSNKGAVESIDLAFDIQWVEDEATSQLAGTYSVGQIDIDHNLVIVVDGKELDQDEFANIYALINVAYNERNSKELLLDASATTFGFEITMDEPANQEEYNLIANAEISITFSYTIDTETIVTTDFGSSDNAINEF